MIIAFSERFMSVWYTEKLSGSLCHLECNREICGPSRTGTRPSESFQNVIDIISILCKQSFFNFFRFLVRCTL